jgi:hypothetical protein
MYYALRCYLTKGEALFDCRPSNPPETHRFARVCQLEPLRLIAWLDLCILQTISVLVKLCDYILFAHRPEDDSKSPTVYSESHNSSFP